MKYEIKNFTPDQIWAEMFRRMSLEALEFFIREQPETFQDFEERWKKAHDGEEVSYFQGGEVITKVISPKPIEVTALPEEPVKLGLVNGGEITIEANG